MHAKEDENQRCPQFARRDVDFAAQVTGLQRIGQPESQARAGMPVAQTAYRTPRGATVLRGAGGAVCPWIGLVANAEKAVQQRIEKIGAKLAVGKTSHQRTPVEVDQANARVEHRLLVVFAVEQGSIKFFTERGIFLRVQPFEQLAAVDRENPRMACGASEIQVMTGLEKLVEQGVGRLAPPRCGPIEIDLQNASVGQATLLHALRRMDIGNPQRGQQMLQKGSLPVARIAKQDRQLHLIVFNLPPQDIIQAGLHVGRRGEW